jgi:hypothetical protein
MECQEPLLPAVVSFCIAAKFDLPVSRHSGNSQRDRSIDRSCRTNAMENGTSPHEKPGDSADPGIHKGHAGEGRRSALGLRMESMRAHRILQTDTDRDIVLRVGYRVSMKNKPTEDSLWTKWSQEARTDKLTVPC